jgi:hypothetical protein
MAKKLTPAKAREILHDKSVHGHPLTDKQRKFFGAISGGAPVQANDGWLSKFDDGGPIQENYNDASVSLPDGFVGMGYDTKGRNYSPAWGGQFAMGGSLPGAVGFTYARTAGSAPSEGPYAKKTLPSAQNGQEMRYYQEGLDWNPKMISENGGWLSKFADGGDVVKDDMGYWNPDNHGKIVEISSPDITMEGVDQPLLGISDTGDTKLMQPGENYKFKGKKVTEYPVAKNGVNQQDEKTLEQLDQLTNFTNYNKPQPGGWLNKYN